LSAGVSRFCLGLFKKVVIANVAGVLVKKYLDVGFDDYRKDVGKNSSKNT